jgi:DedD protein
MALAFWRDKRSSQKRSETRPRARGQGGNGDASDPAAALKVRARRRLIGAAALLLAAVILVPLLLDSGPRPTPDNIPIDIPSEKQPFTPRLSLPPVPDPGQVPVAPPPDLPPAEPEKSKADAGAAKADAARSSEPARSVRPAAEPKETAPPKAPEVKTKPAAEAKPAETTRAKGSRILLQAAALSTDAAAQDLSERLRKAGFAPFTEKVDTADGVRFRVRVGPYATRDEAQRAQARLRALGVSATLVTT